MILKELLTISIIVRALQKFKVGLNRQGDTERTAQNKFHYLENKG